MIGILSGSFREKLSRQHPRQIQHHWPETICIPEACYRENA